ncbi:MAG TPA: M13 family metallopeptidase [Candidatus Acidoferrales bacterium]|nr:M13 family metallopeptidase [Candidatus Acidoferrales bacterium]
MIRKGNDLERPIKSRKSVFRSGPPRRLARKWRHSLQGTFALLVTLILWAATIEPPSAAQQPRQDFLAADVDTTVSPGEDFFQYANGEWFKRNPIPENRGKWGIGNLASEDIAAQLRRISEVAAAKKAPRGSIEQLVGDFWFTGMDSTTANKQGLAPVQPDLDRIDQIRSIRDLIDVVAIFHNREQFNGGPWSRVLFFGHVEQDEKNSDRWIYSLLQSGTSMGSSESYSSTDPRSVKIQVAFREYLFKTFLRLQHDSGKARASADAVYDIEAQLAKAFDHGYGYEKIGLDELSRLAPTIDWNRYLQQIGIAKIDSVNMRSRRFYVALDSLLRTVPLENWKDYLRFWLIKLNSPYLDDEALDDFRAYDSAYTGAAGLPPRWRMIIQHEKRWLGQPLARLFEKEYFPADEKARYQAMAETIRDAFRNRIAHLDWMSDATKQNALLKLAHLKLSIGFPEKWTDFSAMPLRRDSYVLNEIRASKWFHDQEIKRLNAAVDRTEVDLIPDISDAEYDWSNNEMRLRPGAVMAVPGLRNDQLDDAFVYGSTPLGHEISHAFDSEGRHYDAYGNKVDWWTAADSAAFLVRAQVLIDEYNEFMPLDGLHVNGQASLAENMADLVGVRITLDAFKKTEQFKKNERVGGFTPLQRFFLAYAYGFMTQERTELLAGMLKGGSYAPERERVNGVLMNIPEFYEAFNVKPGDRMYRPESARVKIW